MTKLTVGMIEEALSQFRPSLETLDRVAGKIKRAGPAERDVLVAEAKVAANDLHAATAALVKRISGTT